jgi:hypothetical protein
MFQEPGRAIDLGEANRYGQQLFFANMRFQRPRTPRLKPERQRTRRATTDFRPLTWRQDPLFVMDLDPTVVHARSLRADNDLVRYCTDVVHDHAGKSQRSAAVASL